jgi:hypothetical protein
MLPHQNLKEPARQVFARVVYGGPCDGSHPFVCVIIPPIPERGGFHSLNRGQILGLDNCVIFAKLLDERKRL